MPFFWKDITSNQVVTAFVEFKMLSAIVLQNAKGGFVESHREHIRILFNLTLSLN